MCLLLPYAKYILEDKQNLEKSNVFQEKLSDHLRITEKSPKPLHIWLWDESVFSLTVKCRWSCY
jgi:hypothetical protein